MGWGLDGENKLLGGEKLKLWTREYRLGRWDVRIEKGDGRVMGRSRGEGLPGWREFFSRWEISGHFEQK